MGSEGCDSSSPVSSCPVLSCAQRPHPTSAPCPRQLQLYSLSQYGQGWTWELLPWSICTSSKQWSITSAPVRLDFGEGQLGTCLLNWEEPLCFEGLKAKYILNAKYILIKQVVGLISRYNCTQFLRHPLAPREHVAEGLVCAGQQGVTDGHHRCGAPGGFVLLFAHESSSLSQAHWLLGSTGLCLEKGSSKV